MRYLLTAAIAALVVLACASNPPKDRPIPPDQIPPGFEASDCHWQTVKPTVIESGGISSPGGGPQMRAAPESAPEPQKVVACHRAAEHIQKCIGADGNEKPMAQCQVPPP
jgi:hypothetical protein